MSYQILMLVILGSLYATASPTCSNPTVTPSRNTWALDYTGQLYSGYFCVTGSPKTLAWSFLDLSGTTLAFFTFTTNFGSNPCQPATPVPGYNATCQYKGSCYTTTFSVTNKLTSSFNQSTLYLIHSGSSCFAQNISLQACSSPTPNNVPINPSSGVYNTQANFQCSHGLSLFYLNGTTGNTATKCFATSEWENENIVQCWSAPTATLIGNNTICAGNIATFQCTASGGVPSWDRVEVYFNNQNQTLVGNTWTSNPLSSSNNGDIVECRAINSYTAMQEYSNLGRDSKTLIIHYAATNPKFETKFTDLLINLSSGYLLRSDETLTMNCSADGNPAVTCTWTCSPSNCGSLPNTCEINNVNVINSTTITCTVGNGVCGGGTTSITQHITVVPKTRDPYIVVDGTTTTATSITRNKTESLSLACGIVNQKEMNTLIVWKKDGIINFGSDIVTINNLSPEDTGSYSCHTSDAFGNFSSSLYIDVYYAAEGFAVNDGTTSHSNICTWYIAPPGPRSCTITFSLNPTTYTTTLTKDGAMVTNDATNQPQTSTSQSFVFTRNQPSFNDSGNYTLRINNGIFENTFIFYISAINEGQPTTTITPATGGTPPPIPPPDNLGVIIGAAVGGVVAFLLIIILAVYCLKMQINKIHQDKEVTGRSNIGMEAEHGYYEVANLSAYQNEHVTNNIPATQSTNYENLKDNVNVTRGNNIKRWIRSFYQKKQREYSGQSTERKSIRTCGLKVLYYRS
uniref:basement membrane-specific heparan sulfate proteoglycan core protein-like isoform X2 n=1 Tax=Ciona intestinalis TaxID=7719 RepID=UPI000EF521CF|nr:basement membrane-specific heparan sulfate proteoglycan core protein-like isoform X2 [Ciona intestinalis]|eukprot:XP_026695339.1 basement membrane-specific heparan sulfate proteoglycan core protein-like isoform X2 [Ciona intestinalis]